MGLFATYDEYATYAHESFPGCTWTRVHNSEETYISVQIVGYETVVDQKEELVYRRFLFLWDVQSIQNSMYTFMERYRDLFL